MSLDHVINCSASGPVMRGSGLAWDWRKAEPYDVYDRMDFDVPVGENGDNLDRFWVRMQEMRQSLRIVDQCCRADTTRPGADPTTHWCSERLKASRLTVGWSVPKGELGFYLVSDGGISPIQVQDTLAFPSQPHCDTGIAGGLEAGGYDRVAGQHRHQHG